MPGSGVFNLTSPMDDSLTGLNSTYRYGDKIELSLKPKEIRILNFDKTSPSWDVLKELQGRHKMVVPPPPKPLNLKGHTLLGTWEYTGGHTREFTLKNTCILRQREKVIWEKPCTAATKNSITVQGKYKHVLGKDGILAIEGKYKATRAKP